MFPIKFKYTETDFQTGKRVRLLVGSSLWKRICVPACCKKEAENMLLLYHGDFSNFFTAIILIKLKCVSNKVILLHELG